LGPAKTTIDHAVILPQLSRVVILPQPSRVVILPQPSRFVILAKPESPYFSFGPAMPSWKGTSILDPRRNAGHAARQSHANVSLATVWLWAYDRSWLV